MKVTIHAGSALIGATALALASLVTNFNDPQVEVLEQLPSSPREPDREFVRIDIKHLAIPAGATATDTYAVPAGKKLVLTGKSIQDSSGFVSVAADPSASRGTWHDESEASNGVYNYSYPAPLVFNSVIRSTCSSGKLVHPAG